MSAKDEIERMRGPKITMTLLETTIYHVVRFSRPVQQSEPSQVLLELQTLARSWSSSIALDDQENYSKIIFFSFASHLLPTKYAFYPHSWQHYIEIVRVVSFCFVIHNTYNMILLQLVARPPALELVE